MALQTDETKGTAQSNVSVATVRNVNTTVMMTSSSEGTDDDNSIGVHDDNMTNSDDTTNGVSPTRLTKTKKRRRSRQRRPRFESDDIIELDPDDLYCTLSGSHDAEDCPHIMSEVERTARLNVWSPQRRRKRSLEEMLLYPESMMGYPQRVREQYAWRLQPHPTWTNTHLRLPIKSTRPKVCAVSCEDARVLDLWENAEDSPMSWQHYTDTDSTRTQHSVRLDRVLDSDGATDTLEMDIATDTLESELCAITGSVSFERLHRSASRQKRIKRFYELLQLHSNGRVDVEQKIWNGDIMMKYKW